MCVCDSTSFQVFILLQQIKGEIDTAGESLVLLRSCDAAVVSTKKAYQLACDNQSKLFGKMEKANADPAFTAKAKQGVMKGEEGLIWKVNVCFLFTSTAVGDQDKEC